MSVEIGPSFSEKEPASVIGQSLREAYKALKAWGLMAEDELLTKYSYILGALEVEVSQVEDVWLQLHLMGYEVPKIADLTDCEPIDVELALLRLDQVVAGLDLQVDIEPIEPIEPAEPVQAIEPVKSVKLAPKPVSVPLYQERTVTYLRPLTPLLPGDVLVEDDDDERWQEKAICAQTDPEVFFPEKGGSTREAKRVCTGCEVKSECLDYALKNDERFGVWGGLSERERRKLKRP